MALNKSIKIFVNYLLGPALFVWLSWSIYVQLRHQPNLREHIHTLRQAIANGPQWRLYVIILLMIINWGLESRKWQALLKNLEPMSFLRSFKAILSGLAFAMNTPNRIGEYGGRILHVREGRRLQAVSLTVAGSMSQLLVTLFMGCLGMSLLREHLISVMGGGAPLIWLNIFRFVTAFFTFAGLLLYFRLGWIVQGIDRIPALSSISRHISVMEELTVSVLLRVLVLSLMRFLVFGIQYILMLHFLQVDIDWWSGFWTVSILFLLLAMVPTVALLEIGLRWEYSLLLFGMFSSNAVGIYAAATGIWLINLAVPALAGSILILGVRIFSDRESMAS